MNKNCNYGTIAFVLWCLLIVGFLLMHVRFAITPINPHLETTEYESCPDGTTDFGNWCVTEGTSWYGYFTWKQMKSTTTIASEDTGIAIYWK